MDSRITALGTKLLLAATLVIVAAPPARAQDSYDYRILATSKTSTLEKEMNDAAGAGFKFFVRHGWRNGDRG